MKYYKNNEIDNMILNITEFTKGEVWKNIESERNALERCQQRKIYTIALKRIAKGNEHK